MKTEITTHNGGCAQLELRRHTLALSVSVKATYRSCTYNNSSSHLILIVPETSTLNCTVTRRLSHSVLTFLPCLYNGTTCSTMFPSFWFNLSDAVA